MSKVWSVSCVPCEGISMLTECAATSVVVLVGVVRLMHANGDNF